MLVEQWQQRRLDTSSGCQQSLEILVLIELITTELIVSWRQLKAEAVTRTN